MCKCEYKTSENFMKIDKIKVDRLCIVANITNEKKPCYSLLYHEIDTNEERMGYSSYNLAYVLMWKEQYFEIVNNS